MAHKGLFVGHGAMGEVGVMDHAGRMGRHQTTNSSQQQQQQQHSSTLNTLARTPSVIPSRTASVMMSGVDGALLASMSGGDNGNTALSATFGGTSSAAAARDDPTALGLAFSPTAKYRPASSASAFTQRLTQQIERKGSDGALLLPEGGGFFRKDTVLQGNTKQSAFLNSSAPNSKTANMGMPASPVSKRPLLHHTAAAGGGGGAASYHHTASFASKLVAMSNEECDARAKASDMEANEALRKAETLLKDAKANNNTAAGGNANHANGSGGDGDLLNGTTMSLRSGEGKDQHHNQQGGPRAVLAAEARKNVKVVLRPAGQSNTERSFYQSMLRGSSAIARQSRTPAGLLQVNATTNEPLSINHPATLRMRQLLLGDDHRRSGKRKRKKNSLNSTRNNYGGGGGNSSGYSDEDNASNSGGALRSPRRGGKSLATNLLDTMFTPSAVSIDSIVHTAGEEAIRQAHEGNARKGLRSALADNPYGLPLGNTTASAAANTSSASGAAARLNHSNTSAHHKRSGHQNTSSNGGLHPLAVLHEINSRPHSSAGDHHNASTSMVNLSTTAKSNAQQRISRLAFTKMSVLMDGACDKANADAFRARSNALTNILAVINDDPKAKEEVVERARLAKLHRYGRGFTANTLVYPPELAAIIKAKKEQAAEHTAMGQQMAARPSTSNGGGGSDAPPVATSAVAVPVLSSSSPHRAPNDSTLLSSGASDGGGSDGMSSSRGGKGQPTNWMARNANRARLHQHLVAADRARFAEVEQDRWERAMLSREQQFYDRAAVLDEEEATIRGLGKSAAHRWATLVTFVASVQRMRRFIAYQKQEAERLALAGGLHEGDSDADGHGGDDSDVIDPNVLDEAATKRLLSLIIALQAKPRFLLTIHRFREKRRRVAAGIVHSFLITLRDASKMQMRVRQLLAHIRVIQRNVRRYLAKRRAERELWLVMINSLIEERLAFTRQITMDYEKEVRRRKAALMVNVKQHHHTSATAASHNKDQSASAPADPSSPHHPPAHGKEGVSSTSTSAAPPHRDGPSDHALAMDAASLLIQLHGNGSGVGLGGALAGGGNKNRSLQGALMAVRTSVNNANNNGAGAANRRSGGGSGGNDTNGDGGRRAGGMNGGIPLLLVNEATRILASKMSALGGVGGGGRHSNGSAAAQQQQPQTPLATSAMAGSALNTPLTAGIAPPQVVGPTAALAVDPNVTIFRQPGHSPLVIHHHPALMGRYGSMETQRSVEVLRARVEQSFTRLTADELFAVSCLPAAVTRYWRNASKAVFFARETHELPHADRTAIRLPGKYRERLVAFFRDRALEYYHQQVGKWRVAFTAARATYEWELELAIHAAKRNGTDPIEAAKGVRQILPPFPVRKHLPTASEGRFLVLVGFAIQFLEKRALVEASATISHRANIKTPEGRAILEHEKLQIATKSLSADHIDEVSDRLLTKYLNGLANVGGGGHGHASNPDHHSVAYAALGGLTGLSETFVTGILLDEEGEGGGK